jgi:hypothetical protein
VNRHRTVKRLGPPLATSAAAWNSAGPPPACGRRRPPRTRPVCHETRNASRNLGSVRTISSVTLERPRDGDPKRRQRERRRIATASPSVSISYPHPRQARRSAIRESGCHGYARQTSGRIPGAAQLASAFAQVTGLRFRLRISLRWIPIPGKAGGPPAGVSAGQRPFRGRRGR